MYSMLEDAKKEGNHLMIGVLEENPEICEILGIEKVKAFNAQVREWEIKMQELSRDHRLKYMTTEEAKEYTELYAPIPNF